MKRLAWAVAGLIALITAYVALLPAPVLTPDVIAARARAAQPAWGRYDEDVKGLVGAAPVATWHGTPRWVRADASGLSLAFAIDGAWRDYAAPMPILARDPFGAEHLCNAGHWEDGVFVYHLPALAGSAPPWLELRFPRMQTRVQLDAAGYWSSEGGQR
jgi:hypothetical protein